MEGLLPLPGLGLIAGLPGIGKTWLDLSLALAVATGGTWLNHFQARQGPVLLVLEEDDDSEVQSALIVLDTFRRVHDLEENDSGQMSGLFKLLRQLTHIPEQSCSLFLVHHLRKRSEHPEDNLDRLRGSSDIAASVDSVLEVGGQFGNLVVRHAKSKRGPALGTFLVQGAISPESVHLRFVDPNVKAEIDREALRAWLLGTLQSSAPQNFRQLCEAGKREGFGKDRIHKTLEALKGEDLVCSETGPRNSCLYSLTEQSAREARVPPTTTPEEEEEGVWCG
jgi:hypothetical protein